MTDPKPNDPFEPFITVSLGNRKTNQWCEPSPAIAVTSNCPGTTAIHWYTAQTARILAAEITRLADALDPPRPPDPVPVPKKRGGLAVPRKRKAKKAKRK
jgi:hypothetical protein